MFVVVQVRDERTTQLHEPFASREEAETFLATCRRTFPDARFEVEEGPGQAIAFCDECGKSFEADSESNPGADQLVLCISCLQRPG